MMFAARILVLLCVASVDADTTTTAEPTRPDMVDFDAASCPPCVCPACVCVFQGEDEGEDAPPPEPTQYTDGMPYSTIAIISILLTFIPLLVLYCWDKYELSKGPQGEVAN